MLLGSVIRPLDFIMSSLAKHLRGLKLNSGWTCFRGNGYLAQSGRLDSIAVYATTEMMKRHRCAEPFLKRNQQQNRIFPRMESSATCSSPRKAFKWDDISNGLTWRTMCHAILEWISICQRKWVGAQVSYGLKRHGGDDDDAEV